MFWFLTLLNNMIKQKLKKPHNIFFLLCVLFIMFSCNRKQERKIISVQELITDSLLLPVSDLVISKGGINHIPDNDSLISFFDKNSFNIYLYDIKNNSFIDTLSVWKYKDIIVDYELKTKDTLYALLDINHIVKIATDFEKIYDLNYLLQKEVDSFVFTGRISSKFKIFGDTAVVELCTRRKRSDWNGPNKEHLMSNFDIGVKLEDVPKMIYKHNPNSKDLLVQDYYTFRRRVSISKNEAFYSYSHSNELLHTTFQPFQIDTIKIDTNFFFENIPLDYQQTSDFGYITRYTMSQSRFGLIFYDVFRKKVVLF